MTDIPRGYLDIHDHGVIGDLHTVALVGIDGTIDWLCYPHVDSPTVFGALLDRSKGGHFRLCAEGHHARKQLYLPGTNVLITRFLSPKGVAEIADFMVVEPHADAVVRPRLVRRVSSVRGNVRFDLSCEPAFDYARGRHTVEVDDCGARFSGPGLTLALATRVPLKAREAGVAASFALRPGESAAFVMRSVGPSDDVRDCVLSEEQADRLLRETSAYWRDWLSQCTYQGRWREMVTRSALVLKLLTFRPTGAIVAAPTTSLPEEIGGERNWDYRYAWIRDSAFTLYALLRIGFTDEARAFMGWLLARTSELEPEGSLQPVYGVGGRHDLPEMTLDHLEGYKGSSPVRIGNGAAKQLQLDLYGALMDAVYLYNKHGAPISYDLWANLRRILNWLCKNWKRPDKGIWEVRGGSHQFVYSNMMCWVALDRGIRIAEKRGFPGDLDRWRHSRDEIYEQVMKQGWNAKRQAFVQHYGSTTLDASTLLMPLVFFVSPTDPRMLKTIEAIMGELVSDSLVHRYSPEQAQDGLRGSEGTFSLCTFWLVEALTRAGRLEEARLIFEKMLGFANHLGLYSEEVGPSGEALGNFPQAFTHLALISAALNLDRSLGKRA